MINPQMLEGQWNELAGYIKSKWGQLTDDELQQVRGNVQQLVGLIQDKTGWARENIEAELEQLAARGMQWANQARDAARAFAETAGGQVQQSYEQAEHLVQRRPVESVAVAFGSGLIAGVIIGLVIRSR